MSEKRKPAIKIVAQVHGKRVRIELYPARLWPEQWRGQGNRYRVRVNRRWSQGSHAFTLSEVMRQLRMWLHRGGTK